MRISTRPAEIRVAVARRREETYFCRYGIGRVVTIGETPLEVELPRGAADGVPARRASSRWVRLLERYFAGEAVDFDLDIDAYATYAGLSSFERDVYAALLRVPRGAVVSYGRLAELAGRPGAQRAVGSAMARNCLPVILPCHRVVRHDGALGQYGDDPAWKEVLLTLEGVKLDAGRLA